MAVQLPSQQSAVVGDEDVPARFFSFFYPVPSLQPWSDLLNSQKYFGALVVGDFCWKRRRTGNSGETGTAPPL
jgi:hypothetical protein